MKTTLFLFAFLLFSYTVDAQSINWVSLEKAEAIQKKSPEKQILVMFYTDWCGYCRKMNKSTFQDSKVINLINKQYIAVKFNAESLQPVTFHGKKYEFVPQGRSGIHSFAYWTLNGRASYPTIALLNEKGKAVKFINGYKTGKEIIPYLN